MGQGLAEGYPEQEVWSRGREGQHTCKPTSSKMYPIRSDAGHMPP